MTGKPVVTNPAPWFNNLRPGSFRGVPFYTMTSDFEGGRRGAVIDLPLRDDPKVQDIGRATRRFTVDALVIGPEYHQAKNKLIEALEQGGPGKLIHRYYGEMTAEVEPGRPFRVSEGQDFGGCARFSIQFVRVPSAAPVLLTLDTLTIVGQAADKSKSFSIAAFTKKFLSTGPEFIRDHALTVINSAINQVQDLNNQVTGALGAVNQVNQGIKSFAGSAAQLISTPGRLYELGQGGFGLHEAVFTSIGAIANAFKRDVEAFSSDPKTVAREESRKVATVLSLALTTGASTGSDLPAVRGTSSRAQQVAANQAALVNLMQQSAAIEATRAALDVSFESNAAAIAMRDQLDAALEAQAEKCDDDELYGSLKDLRSETIRHLTSVAGDAPKQVDFLARTTMPSLMLAYLAHGDARRADEIISRNGIRHPGFVPGGYSVRIVV